jgi:hypothetical protein
MKPEGALRLRFLRQDGIYRSDVVPSGTKSRGGTVPPPAGRPRAQAKERAGRITLFSSSAMSSGRLFLDRVGRHQSPSPLHRHGHHNFLDRSRKTNYHRTANCSLTGCLSPGVHRRSQRIIGRFLVIDVSIAAVIVCQGFRTTATLRFG